MFRLSPTMTVKQLELTQEILTKWIELWKTNIPVIHFPAEPDALELFITQFIGELRLMSGDLDTVADIVSGAR